MARNLSNSFKDELIECLSQQLSELELFQSMYSSPDELSLDNTAVDTISSFIDKGSEYKPPHLDFVLTIPINGMKVEICTTLPSLYPKESPNVLVRCNQLNRQQETRLNINLSAYIKEIPRGDSCLYTIVLWIQETVSVLENMVKAVDNKADKHCEEDNFARYWIYSHHIYNKRKREAIVSNARELNLNGFSLPGKPGILCIEGDESNCKEWWRIIKSLTWQKIMLKQTEVFDAKEKSTKQKFYKFEEIHFQNTMGSFSKYMDQLGLTNTFNEIFGFTTEES